MSFIKYWTGAAWKLIDTINVFKVYVAPGVWKDVKFLRVYELYNDQVGWREVWAKGAPPPSPPAPIDPPVVSPPVALTVSISPPVVSGKEFAPGTVFTDDDAVITASGGTPPYEYSWVLSSWTSSMPPQIVSPNAVATKFSQMILEAEGFETARFKGIVNDSLGNTGSAFVDAEFRTTETGGLQ